MILTTRYMTKHPNFGDGRWITGADFRGFMLHDVAAAQPDPWVWANGWDNPNHSSAGINGFIGDKEVIITAPSLETPGKVKRMPHCCSPGNEMYIGFEMCNPATLKFNSNHTEFTVDADKLEAAREFVRNCYRNAVELFAMLCKFHHKDPLQDGVILSHKEGGQRDIASDHGDPNGLWDGLQLGYTMDKFRAAVSERMKEMENGEAEDLGYLGFPDVKESDWYADALKWAVEKHIVISDGGRFNPNSKISNAAFVVRLRRMYNALYADLKQELSGK